jgi:hypothetical protein
MPTYRVTRPTLISHESRLVTPEDGEFQTVFPKLKDGREMRLGENIELVKEPDESAARKRG